jgi:hypothetical protein
MMAAEDRVETVEREDYVLWKLDNAITFQNAIISPQIVQTTALAPNTVEAIAFATSRTKQCQISSSTLNSVTMFSTKKSSSTMPAVLYSSNALEALDFEDCCDFPSRLSTKEREISSNPTLKQGLICSNILPAIITTISWDLPTTS